MIQQFKLYKGQIVLRFDDAKHIYTVNNKTIYGVTSITGIIAKPGLIYWAANMAADTFFANMVAGKALDELQIKELADQIRTSHVQKKDKAADLGTMIHDWISEFLKAGIAKKPLPKKPINPEMKNAINSFLEWCKQNKVKFLESERRVYSKKYKYAGTLDAIATINGKSAIIDFKTGNAVYPEMFLQTVAYQSALQEETEKKYSQNIILRLSKEDKEKGIEPFEVLETTDYVNNFKVFLACLKIYSWQVKNKKDAIIKSINN